MNRGARASVTRSGDEAPRRWLARLNPPRRRSRSSGDAARSRRKKIVLWSVLGAGAFLVVCAAVLVVQVLLVRSDLSDVRPKIDPIRDALLTGDTEATSNAYNEVAAATDDARSHSGGPVWWLGSKLPVVGASLGTVRELVVAVDDLVDGPLATVVDVGDSLDPDRLLVDGTVAVDELVAVREPVTSASDATSAILARVAGTSSEGLAGPVTEARTELIDKLSDLDSTLGGAAAAVQVGPDMLGASGPRTYFVAFQNNAEVKGTGGLIGVYGLLRVDGGKVDLVHVGPNDELVNSDVGVVDLGPEYNANYGELFPTFLWSNANSSPHFPYAGQIWAALYEKQSGTHIDGVIAADPAALAHVLRATGPVQLPSGGSADADNVERLLQVDAYAEFDDDRSERKEFLEEVARASFDAALAGTGSPQELLTQLASAAAGRHLQVWSPQEDEMEALRLASATGEMYQGPAPYAGVVLNNVSGAKLDYYLEREVTYTLGDPTNGRRDGLIKVILTNTAPPGLPTFVTDRIDAPPGTYPVGQSRLQLTLYVTSGATITNVSLNGTPVEFIAGTELGHPRLTMWIYPTPGQPITVAVATSEPDRPDTTIVPEQPMARRQR
jgi:hypothetical protein